MKPAYIVTIALSFVVACGSANFAVADTPPPPAPEGFYCSNGLTTPSGSYIGSGFNSLTLAANANGFRGCAITVDGQILCWEQVRCSP